MSDGKISQLKAYSEQIQMLLADIEKGTDRTRDLQYWLNKIMEVFEQEAMIPL